MIFLKFFCLGCHVNLRTIFFGLVVIVCPILLDSDCMHSTFLHMEQVWFSFNRVFSEAKMSTYGWILHAWVLHIAFFVKSGLFFKT